MFDCATHGTGTRSHPILDLEHELSGGVEHPSRGVFAVAKRETAHIRGLAQGLVGFKIGQAVRVELQRPKYRSSPKYNDATGVVMTINPSDYEILVKLDGQSAQVWFCPAELRATTPD